MISERCKDWYHNCNKENFKFFILPLFSLVPYRVKIRVPFMFPFLKCHENFCYLWGPYTQLKAGRGRHYWIFNFFHKGHTINSIAKTGFSTFSSKNSFRKKNLLWGQRATSCYQKGKRLPFGDHYNSNPKFPECPSHKNQIWVDLVVDYS